MSETTAEERATWAVFNDVKDVMLRTGDESQDECPYTIYDVQRLIADVERLTAERDWYKEHYGIEDKAAERYAAQRDEAVMQVSEAAWQLYTHGSHRAEGGYHCPIGCSACAFLNRLSTVTPEDWQKHQKERAQNAGKTEAELRAKYQPCERVSACCGRPADEAFGYCKDCCDGRGYECATHGKPWGECEVKVG